MSGNGTTHGSSFSTKGGVAWRPTKIMNMRDLSKDDDFLSHLLVEKLGVGGAPLLVHKMDASRRLPKTDANVLLQIVRRLTLAKGPLVHVVRQAVDDLLLLAPIRYYLKSFTQKQINAFATHASRYFELYHPSGSIEIAHTSRYSQHTGKSELCILATRPLVPGNVITELKGSMANLTEEEDKELKRTDLRNSDIRRDFSVIHSKQMKKNHLFLGPARFVNHDCENNCELFREGKYITFRVIRPISVGQEITAHYGDGYFGRKNRHCLCETCEKLGRGGYASNHSDEEEEPASESESESAGGNRACSRGLARKPEPETPINVNERRTRSGVYAIIQEKDDESDESEDEGTSIPFEGAKDVPADETDIAEEVLGIDGPGLASNDISPLLAATDDSTPDGTPFSRNSTSAPSGSVGSISRRGRQLATPPLSLSEDVESRTVSPQPQRKRGRPPKRTGYNFEKRADTPSGLAKEKGVESLEKKRKRSKSEEASGERNEKAIKKEDLEVRVLRARPAAVVVETSKAPSEKPEAPRGPDGKPLPTCATCSNVLPVISVNSLIVWGLEGLDDSSKKGKKKRVKLNCPRCMRHFQIYQLPWPARTPGQGGSSLPTPREDSVPAESTIKRVTEKALPVLDKILNAAASSSKHKLQSVAEDERPLKRRKSESIRLGKGKRPHPDPHIRHVTETAQSSSSPGDESLGGPMKRKRGRPRLSSLTRDGKPEKLEPKSLIVKLQPRENNGRFGKKELSNGRFSRRKLFSFTSTALSREERALERERVRMSLKGKDNDDYEEEAVPFVQKFSPGSFASVGLFRTPNPMSFARRSWAHPEASQTSSDETEGPVTPPVSTVSSDSGLGRRASSGTFALPKTGPLTFKPSPFGFARRRWQPKVAQPAEEAVDADSLAKDVMGCLEQDDEIVVITDTPQKGKSAEFNFPFSNRWPGEDSSGGEEDVVILESPNPARFVLQRRASFGSSPRSRAQISENLDSSADKLSRWPTTPSKLFTHRPSLFEAGLTPSLGLVSAGWDVDMSDSLNTSIMSI